MTRLALAAFAAAVALTLPAEEFRHEELFNFDWKCLPMKAVYSSADYTAAGHAWAKLRIPPRPELPEADDSSFTSVDLPHDAQINLDWWEGADPSRAKECIDVWYRKHFTVPAAWKGQRVFLEFDGMALWGDIWVNGRLMAETVYGSTAFEVEITHALRYGDDNLVAVKTYGAGAPASRWYTGCGLNRDVWLKVKGAGVTVARHGVYVTTPVAEADRATVAVEVALDRWTRHTNRLEIVCRVLDPDGREVGTVRKEALRDQKLRRIEERLPTLEIAAPRRWDLDTPYLYAAEVTLVEDGVAVDRVRERFGIRKLEFSSEFGMKLNGRKVIFKAVGGHNEDQGCLGQLGSYSATVRKIRRLKEYGFNGVRTGHNVYSSAFLDACDELGFLVMDEFGDKWPDSVLDGNNFMRVPFTQCWYYLIPEWIRRDRNRPSVVIWSLGNELQEVECDYGLPTDDWGVTPYKMLDTYVKRWDKTRPTTVALYPMEKGAHMNVPDDEPAELGLATEICAYNYLAFRFRDYAKKHPDLIFLQSEMTAGNTLNDYYVMDLDRSVGTVLWGAIDYWGEITLPGQKGWTFGVFDHALEPKAQAQLFRAGFGDEPFVGIGVKAGADVHFNFFDNDIGRDGVVTHWNFAAGDRKTVYLYTNCDEAELFLNGKSLGRKQVSRSPVIPGEKREAERNRVDFHGIDYAPGVLRAVGYNAGKEVHASEIRTAGAAVALKAVVEKPSGWKADGLDYNWVRFYAVDAAGVANPFWNGLVKAKVTGAASLAGLDDGDQGTEQVFDRGEIRAHDGFAMAVLRAGRRAGAVRLEVTGEGLPPLKLDLQVGE